MNTHIINTKFTFGQPQQLNYVRNGFGFRKYVYKSITF